ncbi:MAG: MBL fold metallo-hydrolase [Nanoarchaeota archaeon]|nr:MBL fold metallo-hydrolase [Nanoarchaeota archaeon]
MEITWLGHASVMIKTRGKIIYVDPFVLPKNFEKADYILITHEHYDHCANTEKLAKPGTKIFATKKCKNKINAQMIEVSPSFSTKIDDIGIKCVHSYNIDKPFHLKGVGVGFILEVEGKRVYIAGDTDLIPEMGGLGNVDIAFLPVGGTYTMGLGEAGEAVKAIRPRIVIPYHYNFLKGLEVSNPGRLRELVECEVKILKSGQSIDV